MSNRLSDAMNKLSVDSARSSMARNSMMSVKRQSGLDPSTINAMFPDAAAAIATEKAKYTQQTGTLPVSNRNSAIDPRNSVVLTPTISTPADAAAGTGAAPPSGQNPTSPWGSAPAAGSIANNATSGTQQQSVASTAGQPPMGQFVQPPPSAGGLRSPLPPGAQIQNASINADNANNAKSNKVELPMMSPYGPSGGNWASMVNTPMVANFNQQPGGSNQADMVANATAMKLAALSTVNNRVFLDDVRKYRRTRSSDGPGSQQGGGQSPGQQGQSSPGAPTINLPGNMVMVNEAGQVVRGDAMLSVPGQASMGFGAHRSRPNSPGIALQSATGFGNMPFSSPQTAGFLSAYEGAMSNQLNLNAMNLGQLSGSMGMGNIGMGNIGMGGIGMGGIGMGGIGMGGNNNLNPHSHHHHEGYLSDHSDIARGRSPRGRRGSSKPPEDPTDPSLLQDIPSWLRSLRLHKYTDNLKDMKWTDLVELDDKQLEDRGVNALGARRKMLKVFEQVKGTFLLILSLVDQWTSANVYQRPKQTASCRQPRPFAVNTLALLLTISSASYHLVKIFSLHLFLRRRPLRKCFAFFFFCSFAFFASLFLFFLFYSFLLFCYIVLFCVYYKIMPGRMRRKHTSVGNDLPSFLFTPLLLFKITSSPVYTIFILLVAFGLLCFPDGHASLTL